MRTVGSFGALSACHAKPAAASSQPMSHPSPQSPFPRFQRSRSYTVRCCDRRSAWPNQAGERVRDQLQDTTANEGRCPCSWVGQGTHTVGAIGVAAIPTRWTSDWVLHIRPMMHNQQLSAALQTGICSHGTGVTVLCMTHAKNKFAGRIMHFTASNAQIPVVAVKSRRCGMAPAHIPVFLSQKPSTENGINRPANLILA